MNKILQYGRDAIYYVSTVFLLSCHGYDGMFTDKADTTKNGAVVPCATAVASDSLTMVCVPANTTGFFMGYNGVATPVHTVASITAFAMAQYEVQYGDWVTVKTWATTVASPGYIFANAGLQGSDGAQDDQHPVTCVS